MSKMNTDKKRTSNSDKETLSSHNSGLKPPFSPEIRNRIEAIKQSLINKHQGESISYTSCQQNGCWADGCVLKVRSKDGRVTAIEPDDIVNPNNPREEVTEELLRQGMVQLRPCAMGYAWRRFLYHPDRIIYPMKRVGERGEGKFKRISWDEALDTIVSKMKEMKEKYGPFSIWSPGFGVPLELPMTFFELNSISRLFFYFGAGVSCWGAQSREAPSFAANHTFGSFDPSCPPPFPPPGGDPPGGAPPGGGPPSGGPPEGLIMGPVSFGGAHENPDTFDSKLILLWGFNPTDAQNGTIVYYLRLAREKGIPVICIEPRYTWTAEVLSDQWIPIRPGTDMTMMLGIAHVLFKEDLYDKEFVEKFVEPKGFTMWRDYVLGKKDGVEKSPQWAEGICGVPSETIVDLARKMASLKPCRFYYGSAPGRQIYGEDSQRASNYLGAMIGCIGVPGGSTPSEMGGFCPPRIPGPFLDFKRQPPDYNPPPLINWNKWPKAVLLREKYDKGEITKEEYCREIGNTPDSPLPNLKMRLDLGYICNNPNTGMGVKEYLEALGKQEFIVICASFMNLQAKYADIILPITNDFFEHDYYRDDISTTGLANFVVYCPKKVDPPGEAKSKLWMSTKIAERLGFVEKYNPAYKGDERWDEMSEELHKIAFERWSQSIPVKMTVGEVPSWEEFKKKSVIRFPIKEPYVAMGEQIQGGKPFPTPSGKMEFYSEMAAQIDEKTRFGNKVKPIAQWTPGGWGTFTDPNTNKYPLMLLTPHPLFRQHSLNDNNPLLRDEYRHGVWINPADAKVRRIKENDLVRIYNDLGEMVIPAYVTSRVTPGIVVIHEGAWYMPDSSGVDRRGASNVLIHNEHIPQAINRMFRATDLVQVEKK